MIQLLGLKKDLKVEVREKFSIIQKRIGEKNLLLSEICREVIILSTCNRTEIYFNSDKCNEEIINEIFDKLNWNKEFLEDFFYYKEETAIDHLMKVVCGFDSLILGEDQILGQVKDAYGTALKNKTVKDELKKLFGLAVTCGKEFRNISKLNSIPVSSASIAVNTAREKKIKRFMLLGFGNVGTLVSKYILSGEFDTLYIVVRNKSAVNIEDERVKVISFAERKNYYKYVDCIISCTSAPHTVVWKKELPNKDFEIFDLAVPRDVEEDVYKLKNVKVYDIDEISDIDSKNKQKRKDVMEQNDYIMKKYIEEFHDWRKVQDVVHDIIRIKEHGKNVYEKRYETFKHKKNTKDNEKLAHTLIKSTSDAYTNRAIEVLKEEQLKGCGEACLKIIRRIFWEIQ
ncbi:MULTISPECIES: glutamyl-tRNA reductase [Clostridium]|uniref:glutamyl-tRNA reductase n=1 Tax=Clostridium TaxID=1485 RepID=UPI00082681F8|nr:MULTISPECIES: glutamyl-tRNA reductase [Clostridium]PJI08289.1 glutamyl-tRNA reductase [Clostridium sp. CT7]